MRGCAAAHPQRTTLYLPVYPMRQDLMCAWPRSHSFFPFTNPLPPPRLQVNRGTCRFGRYKIPRRPHPPPRASRVSHHPPQVSGLTLAHPCSPTLTRPHPPPSARPIDSGCAGPFLAPGQRGRNGLPRRCRFWLQRIGW